MSAFLIVNAKVPNELKKSFDKWYEEFHLPEAHKCFKSKIAFRGWIGENEHQAFYQFENLSTAKKLLESNEMQKMIKEFDNKWNGKVIRSRQLIDLIQQI